MAKVNMRTLKLFTLLLTALLLLSLSSPVYATVEYEVNIAHGIQKMSEGRMKEALDFFNRALEAKPGNIEAAYYSGMAYSRLGEFESAEETFLGILERDEDFIDANLELGRLYYILGRCDSADANLDKFISASDDDGLKGYAADLKKACRAEEEEERGERGYFLNLSLGTEYDSNVIVEPDNPSSLADRKSDMRALLYLTAGKTIFDRGNISMKADYSFYLSTHHHLTGFNVNNQQLRPVIEFDLSRTVRPSVGYMLGYTLIGGDLYSLSHKYFGQVSIVEGVKHSTDLIYEYSTVRYWDTPLFQTATTRDGYMNTAGIKQNYSDSFKADLYFYYDMERTETEYWNYDGFRAGGDFSFEILSSLYGTVSGEYSERDYKSIYPSATASRLDKIQRFVASLTYAVNNTFSIQLTESFTLNDSNLELFHYNRNIAGIFLTAGIL
jgi:tetratricopeptide (TPR) repeat protein